MRGKNLYFLSCLPRYLQFILIVFIIILTFDLGMLVFAFFEGRLFTERNRWIVESQSLENSDEIALKSVIMIHGFMGSPYDVKGLAENLQRDGFRVVVPVMPGQSFSTPAVERGRFRSDFYIDWLSSIVQKETALTGKAPILIGFSMGGTLATVVAHNSQIDKLVLIAPFFNLPQTGDCVWTVSKYLSCLVPLVPKLSKGRINSPDGYEKYIPGSYIISLSAFNNLGELAQKASSCASKIKTETLIVLSQNDHVASAKKTVSLFSNMANVSIVTYNSSDHILTYDYDSVEIVKTVGTFLEN